ncbi:hypothetical protein GCM10028818_41300 [Spirosoma horti]
MPISIRFTLRSPKKGQTYANPHPLQVWITVNGQRDHFGAVYPPVTGSKLLVNPKEWQVEDQASSRRDDMVNKHLPKLKAYILEVFDRQCAIAQMNPDFPPTVKSVCYQIQEGKLPDWNPENGWQLGKQKPTIPLLSGDTSLVDVYISRVAALERHYGPTPTKTQTIDVGRWKRGLNLLRAWAKAHNTPVPACQKITLSWLKDYHKWLQTQKSKKQSKPISAAMASRYIGKIGQVLQYMVDAELIERNNVEKQSWPRYDDKEILFLEPEHVAKLFTLNWKRTKGIALWWFLLMCCTGLDYPDAVAYARSRHGFERVGPSGRKILGRRLKPPHEEYDVPLLDEVEWLFAVYPEGPEDISGAAVNRYTDQIEGVLGITWRITNKTARKTFGCLMLINGYYIGEVSRMLGHKRNSTTERHYVRIIGSAVDRARSRVKKSSLI